MDHIVKYIELLTGSLPEVNNALRAETAAVRSRRVNRTFDTVSAIL
jgi:hypothetical protein